MDKKIKPNHDFGRKHTDKQYPGKDVIKALQEAEHANKSEFIIDYIPSEWHIWDKTGIIHDIGQTPYFSNIWRINLMGEKAQFVKESDPLYYEKGRKIIQYLPDEVESISQGRLKSGVYLISREANTYAQVMCIEIGHVLNSDLTYRSDYNPHCFEVNNDIIMITIKQENTNRYRLDTQSFIPILDVEVKIKIDELMDKYVIMDIDYKQMESRIHDFYKNGDINLIEEFPKAIETSIFKNEAETTALMGYDTTKYLEKINSDIQLKKDKAESIKLAIERRLSIEKEKMEFMLKSKREELGVALSELDKSVKIFKRSIRKIYKIIDAIEISLGVSEDLIQISEGDNPSPDTPISLRQLVLYMDEEFGDTKNGGICYDTIEEFDKWLISSGQYKMILPEERCVLVMKPRRKARWVEDPIIKAVYENIDKMTYIILRNGDNLYRIFSDKVAVGEKMFPGQQQIGDMVTAMNDMYVEKEDKDPTSWDYIKIDEKIEVIEDEIFVYKKAMMLINSLMLRRQIFNPLSQEVNIMDISTHNMINFIYDADNLLDDGRPAYAEWLKEINQDIKKGSRIFFSRPTFYEYCKGGRGDEVKDRLGTYYSRDACIPDEPGSNIYVVKESTYYESEPVYDIMNEEQAKALKESDDGIRWDKVMGDEGDRKYYIQALDEDGHRKFGKVERKRLYISYNPGDTIYRGYDSHERQTNLTFTICKSDRFIINYDVLLLDDINYYLSNRRDRHLYLSMMPILRGLKRELIDESKWENNFVEMLANRIAISVMLNKDESKIHSIIQQYRIQDKIWTAINWWKNDKPTVWKRPISKDDKKAMEMIEKEVKSKIKKQYKVKILTGYDNTRMVLGYSHKFSNFDILYLCKGMTKREFFDQIMKAIDINRTAWQTTKKQVYKSIYPVEDIDLIHRFNETDQKFIEIKK